MAGANACLLPHGAPRNERPLCAGRDRPRIQDGLIYLPLREDDRFVPPLPPERVDLIYLCYPNNPTGTVLGRDALADWVRGFLSGFAQVNKSEVRKDSGEILGDFAAIAEACVGEESDEEEAEGSYMELVEYLRFGALNVYMDSRGAQEEGDKPALH